MTLKQAIHQATQVLSSHNIDDPHLEAELLLSHLLGIDRSWLYAHPKQELTATDIAVFTKLVERRTQHEPTAYIVGHKEFFGIDFYVDPRVLIPRPETELLVETSLQHIEAHCWCQDHSYLVADIGTGCGAIAISLARHHPRLKVYATDISTEALQVAKINCHRHGVENQVFLFKGDLLEPLPEPVDLMVANLPYVKGSELAKLSPEIRDFEPALALAGGRDGLTLIRRLLAGMRSKLRPDGGILVEIGQDQGQVVVRMAKSLFPEAKVELIKDLSGTYRVLKIDITSN